MMDNKEFFLNVYDNFELKKIEFDKEYFIGNQQENSILFKINSANKLLKIGHQYLYIYCDNSCTTFKFLSNITIVIERKNNNNHYNYYIRIYKGQYWINMSIIFDEFNNNYFISSICSENLK